MKKTILGAVAVLALAGACASPGPYRDGTWKAEVPADSEGYSTSLELTVRDGRISDVRWVITDRPRNRVFDGSYGEVFSEPLYRQQSAADWKGAQIYPGALVSVQDPQKMDVLAGATWTFRKFRTAAGLALAQAVK